MSAASPRHLGSVNTPLIAEIAAFLEIEEESIKEIIRGWVETFRNVLNKKIDDYILSLK